MQFQIQIFEFLMLLLVVICILHARNCGRTNSIELFTLIIYGILLEELTILFFREYTYGKDFLFMMGDVPVSIGLGWAAIIYSAMETSDRLGIALRLRPMFDTLLALNIDLSIDAIAIRTGFWHWLNGGEWFGVPYGNFFGWICVVFFFSLSTRWLRNHPPGHELIRSATILTGSIVPLMILLKIWVLFIPGIIKGALIAGILLFFLLAVLVRSKGTSAPGVLDHSLLAVPFTFHIFFLALLITEKIYLQIPALLLLSLGMLFLGVVGHFLPSILNKE